MLIDTTLREGEQAYGVYFDLKTKIDLAAGLAVSGIKEIELGWVGQEELAKLISQVRPLAPKTRLGVWSPLRKQDIKSAAALKPDCLNLGVPVSDGHIELRLKTDRPGILRAIKELVGYAVGLGGFMVSVGLEDATRAEPEFALEAALTAVKAGAGRIRISDTVGTASPLEMAHLVRRFKSAGIKCLAVHCHNDFGLATANAATALECGADFADASLLGLGERAGIAALEELAACLALRRGGTKNYDLQKIRRLCLLAAKKTGRSIDPDKPVAGKNLFSCETGLHVSGQALSTSLFEPYAPESIGRRRVLSVGKKSGKSAVLWALKCLGFGCPPEAAQEAVRKVRDASTLLGRPLEQAELANLARSLPCCVET